MEHTSDESLRAPRTPEDILPARTAQASLPPRTPLPPVRASPYAPRYAPRSSMFPPPFTTPTLLTLEATILASIRAIATHPELGEEERQRLFNGLNHMGILATRYIQIRTLLFANDQFPIPNQR